MANFQKVMGVGCASIKRPVYETNIAGFMKALKTRYKVEGGAMDKDQLKEDEDMMASLLLFPNAYGDSLRPNYVSVFNHEPESMQNFVFMTPRHHSDYRKLIYTIALTRFNKSLLDVLVCKQVSHEFVMSLLDGADATDCIASLNISHTPIDEELLMFLIHYLSNTWYLECLNIANCYLGATAGKHIGKSLRHMIKTRKANHKNTKLVDRGSSSELLVPDESDSHVVAETGLASSLDEVGTQLRASPRPYYKICLGLRYFDISGNALGDDGLVPILEGLRGHQDIQFLGLSCVNAHDHSIGILCDLLFSLPSIEYIDLSGNPGITSDSASMLLHMVKSVTSLKQVLLKGSTMKPRLHNQIAHVIARNKVVGEAFEDLLSSAYNCIFNDKEWTEEKHLPPNAEPSAFVDYETTVDMDIFSKNMKMERIMRVLTTSQVSFQDIVLTELARALVSFDPTQPRPTVPHGGRLSTFSISQSETIGRRGEMEDMTLIIKDFGAYRRARPGYQGRKGPSQNKEIFMAIFDGHGGDECSMMAAELCPIAFADTLNTVIEAADVLSPLELPDAIWEPMLVGVFLRVDDTIRLKEVTSGSTGMLVLVLDDVVISANVGDTRAVITRDEAMIRAAGLDPNNYRIEGGIMTGPGGGGMQIRDDIPPSRGNGRGRTPTRRMPEDRIPDSPSLQRAQSTDDGSLTTINSKIFDVYQESESNSQTPHRRRRKTTIDDVALRLSKDHKPDVPEETRRIIAAGGQIVAGRVQGALSVCRSFGDYIFKPYVSCVPYVSVYHLKKYDSWIAIACDGCWDVISDVDCALLLSTCLSAQTGALKLRDEAYRLDSQDNISVICIRLYVD